MGLDRITSVIEALQKAGIRAERSFPVGVMPYLTGPVAAVGLERAQAGSVTVAVRIYSPMGLGGEKCEDTAVLAAETVAGMGGAYQMTGCEFNSQMGLFTMLVLATFA